MAMRATPPPRTKPVFFVKTGPWPGHRRLPSPCLALPPATLPRVSLSGRAGDADPDAGRFCGPTGLRAGGPAADESVARRPSVLLPDALPGDPRAAGPRRP